MAVNGMAATSHPLATQTGRDWVALLGGAKSEQLARSLSESMLALVEAGNWEEAAPIAPLP